MIQVVLSASTAATTPAASVGITTDQIMDAAD